VFYVALHEQAAKPIGVADFAAWSPPGSGR